MEREVNIVDYKSGDVDRALLKTAAPGEGMTLTVATLAAGSFYALLVDNYSKGLAHKVSAEFDFIEPDKQGKISKREDYNKATDNGSKTNKITGVDKGTGT